MMTEALLSSVEGSGSLMSSSRLDFGDSRLLGRFHQIVSSLQYHPDRSFPVIFKRKAKLEGFYRFLNNDHVTHEDLIESSCSGTRESISNSDSKGNPIILAIHDTTSFDFTNSPQIEGIGRLSAKKRGFFGHFCIGATGDREILGLLGLKTWIRKGKSKPRRAKRKKRCPDPNQEILRWPQLIHQVQNSFDPKLAQRLIHVADREADDYVSYCHFLDEGIRFVFRAKYDRNIHDDEFSKLFDSVREARVVCEREVNISPRKAKLDECPKRLKDHPPRKKRTARLGISAKSVEICRTDKAGAGYPRTLGLNFVRVFELDPPLREKPIEWILITSEPIQSDEDLLKIVDSYRARWTIEEYFHALKTGCAFEKRGLMSLEALLNCLALFAPIACKLYNLKMLGRKNPEKEVQGLVTPLQIKIIAQQTQKSEQALSQVGGLMYGIAALGGHLKHNGLPGWQVLARGYERLLQLEEGCQIALQLNAICVE